MDLKLNTDASLLFGPVIWNGDGYSVITNAFSLCCNTIAIDVFKGTTKTDITVQSGGTNDVVFVANGYCSIQLVASQVAAVDHYRLSYQYTSTLPAYELFDVIQPEAWDAKYGTLASNIVNIKAGTTSIAINVSSTLAQVAAFSASAMRDLTSIAISTNSIATRMVEFGSSASLASAVWGHTTPISAIVAIKSALSNTIAINVGVASVLTATTSVAINVNSLVVSAASLLRDTASVAARLVIFNTSTAIALTSSAVATTSILAQIAIFSASVMRDLTSIGINTNSIAVRALEFGSTASLASGIWGHLTPTSMIVAIKSSAIGVASLLVATTSIAISTNSIAVNVASLLVATTSIAIGVNSIAVHALEFGSSASLASAVWGHTTAVSGLVAIHSTLSNTIAINAGVLSVASSVWDVVRAEHVTVGTFGEVTTSDSLASQVWGHTTSVSLIVAVKSALSNTIAIYADQASVASAVWGHTTAASLIVAAKSALSNTIYCTTLDPLENAVPGAYGVGTAGRILGAVYVDTSSLLSNIVHLEVQVESTMSTVNHLDLQVDSVIVSVASIGVAITSLMVHVGSLPSAVWDEQLSQHSAVGVAGAYLYAAAGAYTPADVAQATWEYTTSQASTVGMAGAYLMAAGGAADPLLNAVPGGYGVGTAGKALGQLLIDTTSAAVSLSSILSNIAHLNTQADSMAVNIVSTIVGVQSILVATTSASIGIASVLDNLLIMNASTVISLASLLANVTTISAAIAALNNISATDVNTQVLDVLSVDTFAQPGQEAPAATTTMAKMMAYVYKFLRNKITTTSAMISIYADDATTTDHRASLSDDGTTFTRGEFGTGA